MAEREKDGRFARGNRIGEGFGAPPMYKTVADMQAKIDAYIDGHVGRQLEDKDGNLPTVPVQDFRRTS